MLSVCFGRGSIDSVTRIYSSECKDLSEKKNKLLRDVESKMYVLENVKKSECLNF